MLGTDIEVLGKRFLPFTILQPLITHSWKRRSGFFVERLVQPTTAQFGIFNIKRKYIYRCLTSALIRAWNMHIGFYQVLFISDIQTFYVREFLNAMTS